MRIKVRYLSRDLNKLESLEDGDDNANKTTKT